MLESIDQRKCRAVGSDVQTCSQSIQVQWLEIVCAFDVGEKQFQWMLIVTALNISLHKSNIVKIFTKPESGEGHLSKYYCEKAPMESGEGIKWQEYDFSSIFTHFEWNGKHHILKLNHCCVVSLSSSLEFTS